jgi:hypothetical protein
MGIFSSIFGRGAKGSSKGLCTLKSLGYIYSADEQNEIDKSIEALKSDKWRDWENPCIRLGRLRVDDAITDIKKLLWKKDAKTILNVTELSLMAIFQIGGNNALEQLWDLEATPKHKLIIQPPFREWAYILATTLEHLSVLSPGINDNVKNSVLGWFKRGYLTGHLSIPELWAVSAASPGLYTACLDTMCNRLEEQVSDNLTPSPEDLKYANEFSKLANGVWPVYNRLESYNIGYSYRMDYQRINKIVGKVAGKYQDPNYFPYTKYYYNTNRPNN